MHYQSIALAFAAVPAALALPSSNHGHGHHGHHGYEAYKSGHVSASGSSSAPYNFGNGTLGAAGTAGSTGSSYVTLRSTLFHTLSASESAAPSGSIAEAGSSNAESCGATATVTNAATVTVTVSGNSAPAESGVESSAAAAPSSIAPTASASGLSESSAPVVSSVTPASTSAVPEGRAPSTVETYNSVAPSVTPVASSAIPVKASSTTPSSSAASAPAASSPAAAASSPVAASPVASADYCTDTLVPEKPYVYTGANFTGGVKGEKRGIVFVDGIAEMDALVKYAMASPNIHWLGNYFSAPPGGIDGPNPHPAFIPQMYGRQSQGSEWDTNAARAVKNGDKYFLSFGEPGTPNAKNYVDAEAGAQLYMSQMQPYTKQGVTIGAPGSLGADADINWNTAFLCACQKLGCDIGFQAGHWFDHAAPLEQQLARAKGTIEDYIIMAKGKPVWFDNIWARGTAAEQTAFMDALVPWLEDNPAIMRYGFVPMDGDASYGDPYTSGGSPTPLGEHFASL